MSTKEEEREVEKHLAMRETLPQVQDLVNELHAFHRVHCNDIGRLYYKLPSDLTRRIKRFLSGDGLKRLPSQDGQDGRRRNQSAVGLCLENARDVEFIDTDLVGKGELFSSELEALHRRRLESSTALDRLPVKIPANEIEQWESESCRLVADIITRAKSLHSIRICYLPLSGQSAVAKAVAASGHGPPHLKELTINLEPPEDEALAGLLGEAIASHQSLSTVRISVFYLREETSGSSMEGRLSSVGLLLSNAFLDPPFNTSINSLLVDWSFVTVEHEVIRDDLPVLSQVLQTAPHLTQLELKGLSSIQSGDLRGFFRNIRVNGAPYLQSLSLQLATIDVSSFAMLVELFESESMQALKHFSFEIEDYNVLEVDWTGFYASLTMRLLESVSLRGQIGYSRATKTIREWIRSSKTLQTLTVCPQYEDLDWRSFFSCLKENNCLKSLTVLDTALRDDDAYKVLLEVLQVNSTLQEINWRDRWRSRIFEGSSRLAAVREALKAKARQESYLAELRKGLGQAEWQSPKCGRVFFCGSPEAGKTRLTRTMCKVANQICEVANKKGPMKILKRLKEKLLQRTEGVEIHMLRNKEDMQILLWDLAGHDIFRALQEFLFPRVSGASLFVFVFSPFKRSSKEVSSKKKELKPQLRETFEKELREWLRFIISNSAPGSNLPELMVVISHQDLCKSMNYPMDLEWKRVLSRFIVDFWDVIHIHPTLFLIDGHEPNDVKPIVDEVYSFFLKLFQKKLFRVPSACYNLSQHLVRWTSQNPMEPILDDQAFFKLCGEVQELRTFSEKCQEHDIESMKLLKAVGSYLHDVGAVIDMTFEEFKKQRGTSRCNLFVVNPNWLTHTFLGRFIGFEQGFQLTLEEEGEWAERCVDGFVSEVDFQTLLPKRVESIMKQFPKVTLKTVRDLMENLDLLYVTPVVDQEGRLTDNSRFFIPTFFKQKSEETLKWQAGVPGDCFLGVRLRCKDSERTYLSPSFFSRFQVTIWRKFMEDQEMKSSKPVVNCKFNLIAILVDGFQILIESDVGGGFIDVLIQSAKSREIVWNYAEEYIVKEIREFCASSKGCPGVNLVMDIIRTECVKRLTLCKHRQNQSVAREHLKKKLMESVQKVGLGSEATDLYMHTWHSVPEAELAVGFGQAVELLPQYDVHDVYTFVKSKTQAEVDILKEVIREVDIDLEKLLPDATNPLQKLEEKKIAKSLSLQRHEDVMRAIKKGNEDVLTELGKLKCDIEEMNRSCKVEVKNLSQKLDQLMGQSMSTTGWPKRPYFTHKDVNLCHRITAIIDIGKPLMLHFECEARDGHHMVPNQPGYGITVEKENREALRQISNISVRVMQYLMKAGLHISVGVGDLVPELETSNRYITSLTSSPVASLLGRVHVKDGRTSNQPTCPCSPEEAWTYLQDFLESNLRSRITEVFLLHRVEYFDTESSRAWLCHGCLDAELKANKVKKL